MNVDWVAASVRARAMARRRLGRSGARRVAAAGDLPAAVAMLAGTAYDDVTGAAGLVQAQHRVSAAVLWQLRVLAGWMPAGAVPLARSAAAGFERENLLGHVEALTGRPAPPAYDLGALGTVWPRAAATDTVPALLAVLSTSAWGRGPDLGPLVTGSAAAGPAPTGPVPVAALRDALTASWLRRLAGQAPAARGWAVGAAVLLVARAQVLERRSLPAGTVAQLDGLLGHGWHTADDLDGLRATLGPRVGHLLQQVTTTGELWRADVELWGRLATEGGALLRRPLPGPEHVVGALAVLAADAFRLRAALAAASSGDREVFSGVA